MKPLLFVLTLFLTQQSYAGGLRCADIVYKEAVKTDAQIAQEMLPVYSDLIDLRPSLDARTKSLKLKNEERPDSDRELVEMVTALRKKADFQDSFSEKDLDTLSTVFAFHRAQNAGKLSPQQTFTQALIENSFRYERRPDQVISIIKNLEVPYRRSSYFHWLMAEAYFQKGEYETVLRLFESMRSNRDISEQPGIILLEAEILVKALIASEAVVERRSWMEPQIREVKDPALQEFDQYYWGLFKPRSY